MTTSPWPSSAVLAGLDAALQAAGQAVVDGPASDVADSGDAIIAAGVQVTLPVGAKLTGSEQQTVYLALRAGMPPRTIADLLFRQQKARTTQASTPVPVMTQEPGADPADLAASNGELLQALAAQIAVLNDDYLAELKAELLALKQLPVHVKLGTTPATYGPQRAVYFAAGYRDPARTIFPDIATGTFLTIDVYAHTQMLQRLGEAQDRLITQGVSLEDMAAQVNNDVSAFQPRNQPASTVISNHALGMAVDINPQANPRIIGAKGLFRILEQITGFDLHGLLTELGYPLQRRLQETARLSGEDPGHALGELDKLVSDLHQQTQTASGKLQDWLDVQVAKESAYRQQTAADGEAKEAALLALANAQAEADAAALKAARTQFAAAVGRMIHDEVAFRTDAEVSRLEDLRAALRQTEGDKAAGILEQWRTKGISNLPVDLVMALIGSGLGWGAEYQNSKDLMHFELSDSTAKPLIIPDSEPINLDKLFAP